MPQTNPFEQKARERKAGAYARVLLAHGATPEVVKALPELGWKMAAELAGQHLASAATKELTRGLVAASLSTHTAAEVFARL